MYNLEWAIKKFTDYNYSARNWNSKTQIRLSRYGKTIGKYIIFILKKIFTL